MNKKTNWILIGLLPIQILIFVFICNHPVWVENYYMPVIFKPLTSFLRQFIGQINFSIGLFLNNIFILVLLGLAIYKIRNKTFFTKQNFLQTTAFFSVLYFCYMIFWGMVYNRQPLDKLLGLNRKNIAKNELLNLTEQLVYKSNYYREKINTPETGEVDIEKIRKESIKNYEVLGQLNPLFKYNYPSIKPAVMSNLMSSFGTAGLYYFFSGEANINTNLYAYELPFVVNHEIAHQLGFASEDEANFVSYLSCRASRNNMTKYATASELTVHALAALVAQDSIAAKGISKKISPKVMADYKAIRQRWRKFENPIEKYVVRNFYDFFLKSNGQANGNQSYGLVVELLVADMRANRGQLIL